MGEAFSPIMLGQVIKGWRENQRPQLGTRAVADMIGISPTTLNKLENGHEPDRATMQRIWGWLTYPER